MNGHGEPLHRTVDIDTLSRQGCCCRCGCCEVEEEQTKGKLFFQSCDRGRWSKYDISQAESCRRGIHRQQPALPPIRSTMRSWPHTIQTKMKSYQTPSRMDQSRLLIVVVMTFFASAWERTNDTAADGQEV